MDKKKVIAKVISKLAAEVKPDYHKFENKTLVHSQALSLLENFMGLAEAKKFLKDVEKYDSKTIYNDKEQIVGTLTYDNERYVFRAKDKIRMY